MQVYFNETGIGARHWSGTPTNESKSVCHWRPRSRPTRRPSLRYSEKTLVLKPKAMWFSTSSTSVAFWRQGAKRHFVLLLVCDQAFAIGHDTRGSRRHTCFLVSLSLSLLQSVKTYGTEQLHMLDAALRAHQDEMKQTAEKMRSQTSSDAAALDRQEADIRERVNAGQQLVQNFLQEELRQDVPTGKTFHTPLCALGRPATNIPFCHSSDVWFRWLFFNSLAHFFFFFGRTTEIGDK